MKNLNEILPAEIISDILTHLPAESVLECKAVCKPWKNLIQHPAFPKTHLARLNHPDSTGKLSYVIAVPDDDVDDDDYDYNNKCLYYFEYNDNEDWNCMKPIRRKINFKTDGEGSYICIGSFNGLICVYGTQPTAGSIEGPAIVFNPVTREYIVLPEFDSYPAEYETKEENYFRYIHLACGFGYLAETNEYKVVRIYMCWKEPTVVEVEVYTVGSGKGWRHVGNFDLGFIFYVHCQHTHGVFLNGCLHWRNTEGGGVVVVFDLVDEKFREHIAPPPILTGTNDDEDEDGFIVIGVSNGGVLYYAVYQCVGEQEFDDVWLLINKKKDNHGMKEQVDHQSWGWSKVTSLDQREPLAFTERGTALFFDQGNIKVFSSKTSTWRKYADFSEISRQIFPYKHTFISLKELGEEDVERIDETDSSDCDSD